MQYFSPNDHFDTNLATIQNDIEKILQGVSSIYSIHIIGGEPLLFKELPELMYFLASKKQIKALELFTNATIPFSQKLLESLAYKKTRVIISDYSANPELKKPCASKKSYNLCKRIGLTISCVILLLYGKIWAKSTNAIAQMMKIDAIS